MAEAMGEDSADSVIHRKAQVARDGFDAREMSPAKALRLALAKAAARLMGLALTVRTVEQTSLLSPEVEEAMGDEGLLVLLDGPDHARGVVRLDLQMVAALIEMQLKGRVIHGDAEPRPFTATDAAIAQPLINAVLDGLDETLTEAGLANCAQRFRFGDRVADARTLALALSEPDFDHFRLSVDLAGGAKSGVLDLVLPKAPHKLTSETDIEAQALAIKLEQNALNAPVTLDAILGRVRAPLHDVCEWKPGTVLPLSPDVLTEARLLGAGRHVVASVKLGQLNGFRAVRMIDESAERGFAQSGGAAEEALNGELLDMVEEDPLADMPSLPSLEDGAPPAPLEGETSGSDADLAGLMPFGSSDLEALGNADTTHDEDEEIDIDQLLAASALPTPAE
ncbi:MAG: FliM/FliN family flagellar motor switch protein [Pseudomonadota bacterium]